MLAAISMDVGDKLKRARLQRGWSLRLLSEKSGYSASFHSQVELGQSSPSLGSLEKIGAALDLSLAELVAGDEPAQSPVLRHARRDGVRSEWSKAFIESLLPQGPDERLEAFLLKLDREGKTGTRNIGAKTVLLAYVTTGPGQLVLSAPDEQIEMQSGDSLSLEGPRGISWENTGTESIEVLLLTFRYG